MESRARTAGERTHRVFHRIGVVLAVIAILLAAGTIAAQLPDAFTSPVKDIRDYKQPYFYAALVWGPALALLLYVACRAIGWIVAAVFGD